MSDSIRELVKQMQMSKNAMLEKMAEAAVAKWGIDNCKLVEERNGDTVVTWRFEPINQPQPTTTTQSVVIDEPFFEVMR